MPPLTSPNPDLYYLGRGVLWIAPYAAVPTYVDVGNCPSFTYQPTEKNVEHFSSRTAEKQQDEDVPIQTGIDIAMTLDEISIVNLQKFLRATLSGTNKLYANKDMAQRWSIKFVTANQKGENAIHYFHKVKLAPAGAFNLIGDDWGTLQFSGKCLADNTYHSTSPLMTSVIGTTTTTTTTTAP